MSRISPVVLLVIVILAIVFFMFGLLQLLIRCLMKRPSFSSISQSNRFPDASTSHTFQRQLQQLFRLHDSGVDQALIDSLPVFYYKEITGLKEPFDCAVCLCEFTDADKLKLLPNCSHAFHIHCIETWLLSNATCPLCRSLIDPATPTGNPLFSFNDWNFPHRDVENEVGENANQEMLFSVRLGKLRNVDDGLAIRDNTIQSEASCSSSSSLDARRCYSMGAFQYIVGDGELQVALSTGNYGTLNTKARYCNDANIDGKKINARSRGDSLSVSKIWLWSKKDNFLSSSDANKDGVLSSANTSSLA